MMQFLRNWLLVICFLTSPAWATWTKIQSGTNSTCPAGTTTCTVTLSATGTGNLLVFGIFIGSGPVSSVTISSVSGAGTWSLCPSSSCQIFNTYTLDFAYNPSSTSGVTSITVTISSSVTSWGAWAAEYSYTNGPISLDTEGTLNNAACTTTCAGVALTLTGSNDTIIQATVGSPNANAISGTYTNPTDLFSGVGFAGSINTSSGTAPNWTLSGSGHMVFSAVAFKETTPKRPLRRPLSF